MNEIDHKGYMICYIVVNELIEMLHVYSCS
jgi:hypothetical protein